MFALEKSASADDFFLRYDDVRPFPFLPSPILPTSLSVDDAGNDAGKRMEELRCGLAGNFSSRTERVRSPSLSAPCIKTGREARFAAEVCEAVEAEMDDWEIDWLHTCAQGLQIPDLSGIFCNEADLTTIASAIGEVLDIDEREVYFTRLAGPVITVGLEWGPRITVAMAEIGRLPGYIRIPSLDENNPLDATIPHKILYSGHPDECLKCRKFGRMAKVCTTRRSPLWDDSTISSSRRIPMPFKSSPTLEQQKFSTAKEKGEEDPPIPSLRKEVPRQEGQQEKERPQP